MGRDKATLKIDGQTLFSRTLETLRELFPHVLIGGERSDLATPEVPCVPDIYPGSALGGLHAVLSAAQTPWIFVVPCDLAHPDSTLMRFVLNRRAGNDLVVPRTPAGLEPLFALYHKNCLRPMEQMLLRGDYRIYDFYPEVRVRYLEAEILPEGWERALRNLNTPGDLRHVLQEDP
jgi:molybdopterin-guanine dinucleotide biosynthesis protein A